MFYRKIVAFLLFLLPVLVISQTEVSGVVVDEQDNPVTFANVIFKGSTQGAFTDEHGNFLLESDNNYTHIIISFVGFQEKEIRLTSNVMNDLRITLQEDAATLDEVLIVTKPKKRLKKKENPAYRILKGIWANKKQNGLNLVDQYKYKQYTATEFGVNNLDSTVMKTVFKKSYDSIAGMVEKFRRGKNFYVPLFLSEEMTDVYGDNKLDKERRNILGTKRTGVSQDSYFIDMLENTFRNVDITKSNILIFGKPFLNPLATSGFGTYDYVLKDSTVVNNEKQYRVFFFPREEGDLAFLGNFVVSEKNFSIKRIHLYTDKKANLNLVRNLSIEKSFSNKNDSVFVPLEDYFEADLTPISKADKSRGVTIKQTKIYKDYIFDQEKEAKFYDEEEVIYNPNKQLEKGEEYWANVRLEGTKQNANSALIINSVKNTKRVKNISNLMWILVTGYIPLGNSLEYGSIYTTIGNNNVEGLRLRAGLQTYKSPHDRFRASAYIAYGLKDEEFKFGGNAAYVLSYKPRFTTQVGFSKDIEQLGAQLLNPQGLFAGSFGSQSLANRGDNFFLSKVDRYSASIGYEPANNILFNIKGEYAKIKSAAPVDKFTINYIHPKGGERINVDDPSLSFSVRYTPGRNVMGYGIVRRFNSDLYPTFILNYQRGFDNILDGDFAYDKVQFYYNQPFAIGNYGVFDATLEFGKTFGEVPISLLSVVPGNQSLTVSRNTFSLMNYYEFVTDTYATGHFLYRFNGFIMNRIPLIKKLKLRSLLLFRGAWGTISDENIAINRATTFGDPLLYNAPKNKLYYEYGVGVENIGAGNLRIFRFDFIWRGSYLNNPGFDVPKFGIRMGIRPRF